MKFCRCLVHFNYVGLYHYKKKKNFVIEIIFPFIISI